MSTDDDGRSFPKSMRQKRILDAAAENPGASVDELASMVPSATTDLIERVFEEHGDPAADDGKPTESDAAAGPGPDASDAATDPPAGTDASDDGAAADTEQPAGSAEAGGGNDAAPEAGPAYPSAEDLSAKQREVLSVVAADPEATQAEIGDRLNVTQTTVNSRVNSIEGFDWSERESFVDAVFDDPPEPTIGSDADAADATEKTAGTTEESEPDGGETAAEATPAAESELDRLRERVAALEAGDGRRSDGGGSAFDDPELVHKVVHACMASDRISEAEELRVLKAVLER